MKVALTGATGHLGGAILRELLSREIQVRALLRPLRSPPLSDPLISYVTGQLEDPASLKSLMSGCDTVVHAAGLISVDGDAGDDLWKVNVEGLHLCLRAARECGVRRFVHISTIHTFQQEPALQLLDESREKVRDHATAYDISKLEGEKLVRSFHSPEMDVIIIHPTAIIGPYDDKPSRMGEALIQIYKGRFPFAFPAGFDFCDSRDVASGIVNAIHSGQPGQSYILGGRWAPLRELSSHVSSAAGKRLRVIEVPFWWGWIGLPFVMGVAKVRNKRPLYTGEALRTLKEGSRMVSSAKAERELSYTARPLADTIRDTLQWFREKGYLD